ncbi:MAG: T9SS type A sorting domain-containing protein, partial [Ignavibacteria bacterium]|nr:T9SS type A sorting domain-containing protein [Ignavibacteria bacterium]
WISSSNLLKTTNAGQNWSYYNFYNNRSPSGIHFPDSLTGYAFGRIYQAPYYINFIQKTTNGGLIWSEIYTIQNSGSIIFTGIYFINAATGFVGRMGTIWKTTNGGGNWIEYHTPGWRANSSFFFVNPSTGWVVADFSYTSNGGINWTMVSSIGDYLNDIYFINPLTGWVCGESGIIYKTTNGGGILGVSSQSVEIPGKYNLYQNYPNPFNAMTKLKYDVLANVNRQSSNIKLAVFDVTGREIAVLVNANLQPGTYEYTFDGTNLTSGLYFYKLTAGEFSETKKMILLK